MKPAATDHWHSPHSPLSPPTKNSPEVMAMTETSYVPFGYHFRMTATDIQSVMHYLLATGGNDIPPQSRYEEIYGRHPRDLLVDGSPCWFFSSTLQISSKGNSITHHRRIAEGGQWRRTSKMQEVRTSEGDKIGEIRKFEFRIKNSPDGKEWIKSEFLATEYRAWFASSARLSTVALYNVYITPRRHRHLPIPPAAASDDAIPVDAIPVVVAADPVGAVPVAILSAPPVTADQLPTGPSQRVYAAECFPDDNPEWCFSFDEVASDPCGAAVPDHEPIPDNIDMDDQPLVSGNIDIDAFALPEEPITATQDERFDMGDLVGTAAADVPVWATTDETLDNEHLLDNQYSSVHGYGLLEGNPVPNGLDQHQHPQPLHPTVDQFPAASALIYDNDTPYFVDPMIDTPVTVFAELLFGGDEEQSLGRILIGH